ncbi:hypothetical protein ABZ746_09425 [Streptomyces sp. NPDC020096]
MPTTARAIDSQSIALAVDSASHPAVSRTFPKTLSFIVRLRSRP